VVEALKDRGARSVLRLSVGLHQAVNAFLNRNHVAPPTSLGRSGVGGQA